MMGLREHFDSAADLRAHYRAVRKRTERVVKPLLAWTTDGTEKICASSVKDLINIVKPPPTPVIPGSFWKEPMVGVIKRAVCKRYLVSEMDLVSDRRTASLVLPRHIAMYLCKTLTPMSLPRIGRRFGGRDHTTVLNAVRKIEAQISRDSKLATEIDELKAALRA